MDTSVSQDRPAPPELWWSPTIGVWRHTPRGPMLTPGFEMVNDPDGEHFRETLPDDAVQLVPDRSITDLEQELYNRAVTAENVVSELQVENSRLAASGADPDRAELRARVDRALNVLHETPGWELTRAGIEPLRAILAGTEVG